jgi:chromatin assembly factor 1 subunit A
MDICLGRVNLLPCFDHNTPNDRRDPTTPPPPTVASATKDEPTIPPEEASTKSTTDRGSRGKTLTTDTHEPAVVDLTIDTVGTNKSCTKTIVPTGTTQSLRSVHDAAMVQPGHGSARLDTSSPPRAKVDTEAPTLAEASSDHRTVHSTNETQTRPSAQYDSLRLQAQARAQSVLQRCRTIAEEDFTVALPKISPLSKDEILATESSDFPEPAVECLAALVEGSALPLAALAAYVANELNGIYNTKVFTHTLVTTKIPLVANRKQYVKHPSAASVTGDGNSVAAPSPPPFRALEDDRPDHVWRWELTVPELLEPVSRKLVLKARSARRKLAAEFQSCAKVLQVLTEMDAWWLREPAPPQPASTKKVERLTTRLVLEQTRLLKYARDEEAAKLAEQAQRKKLREASVAKATQQAEAAAAKQRIKEQAAAEKQRKKDEAEAEKQRKKDEADRKLQEKEDAAREATEAKQAKLRKQKSCLMSFLSTTKKASEEATHEHLTSFVEAMEAVDYEMEPTLGSAPTSPLKPTKSHFDVVAFRAALERGVVPSKSQACSRHGRYWRASRHRRTKMVNIEVFVTVVPENGAFGAQPFAEQQTITVPNKYKFLRFHEDVRPPYFGTWSKRGSIVTGKTPFRKETTLLEYDYDSEAEWEEGDDEIGEDLENGEGDDDEEDKEEEEAAGDDEDGWLAADDEIDDELDDETRRLRIKALAAADSPKQKEQIVHVIAPRDGKPIVDAHVSCAAKCVQGLDVRQASRILASHKALVLYDCDLFLDAFPPELIDESFSDASPAEASNKAPGSQEMSEDDFKTVAKFVHNCTLASKDKVVDEFRKAHESVTSSRAHALRVLESMADKKKHPVKGIYWEVKGEVLDKLGLEDLKSVENDSQDVLRTIAKFVHNSTLNSKERVVDELLIAHESIASSRAEAMRILESVAEKRKHPVSGAYWQVKEPAKSELGLADLSSNPPILPGTEALATALTMPTEKERKALQDTPSIKATSTSGKKRKTGVQLTAVSSTKKATLSVAVDNEPRAVKPREPLFEKVSKSPSKKRKEPPASSKILTSFLSKKPAVESSSATQPIG